MRRADNGRAGDASSSDERIELGGTRAQHALCVQRPDGGRADQPRRTRLRHFFAATENRIVFLGTPIDDVVANLIVAQLLYLAQEDQEREIQMYINSPGGQIDAGLAIYDTMHLIQPRVATTCIGMAASMGAVLLAGGAKGKRSALPNSRILIHQASAGFQGTASDIEVQAREILRMNARLQEMMAADTGRSVDQVAHDINRDYWMSAPEARDYGVIDLIHGQTAATQSADIAEAAVQAAEGSHDGKSNRTRR